MIRAGFVQVLFAGNALATHDIEQAFFRTSLGIKPGSWSAGRGSHEHSSACDQRIRGWVAFVKRFEQGMLKSGIMFECIKNDVEYVLAGSIRDDGPLPDVMTDAVQAVDRMRELRADVGFCLMIATTLLRLRQETSCPRMFTHACVDINPATVTKLADRGTAQSVGIVTDVEPFLRALAQELLGE